MRRRYWIQIYETAAYNYHIGVKTTYTEYVYTPLAKAFIKSFPQVTKKNDWNLIHLIMVMAPYYPCSVFSFSHYSYKNTKIWKVHTMPLQHNARGDTP